MRTYKNIYIPIHIIISTYIRIHELTLIRTHNPYTYTYIYISTNSHSSPLHIYTSLAHYYRHLYIVNNIFTHAHTYM